MVRKWSGTLVMEFPDRWLGVNLNVQISKLAHPWSWCVMMAKFKIEKTHLFSLFILKHQFENWTVSKSRFVFIEFFCLPPSSLFVSAYFIILVSIAICLFVDVSKMWYYVMSIEWVKKFEFWQKFQNLHKTYIYILE